MTSPSTPANTSPTAPVPPTTPAPQTIVRPKHKLAAKIFLIASAILFALTVVLMIFIQTMSVNPIVGLGTFCTSCFCALSGLIVASMGSEKKTTV